MPDRAVDQSSADIRPVAVSRPPASRGQPPRTRVAGSRRDRAPAAAVPPAPTPTAAPRTPPPRPAVSIEPAPPVDAPSGSRPRTIRISAGLWFAACAAGVFGVFAALVDGGALRDRLSAGASAADPAATEEAVRAAVTMTVLVVLGAVVTLAVLTLIWTTQLLRRKSWARTMVLITGLVTLFIADVGQSLVTGGADVDRFLLLAQLPLVIVATGLLLARSSRAWLRGEDG